MKQSSNISLQSLKTLDTIDFLGLANCGWIIDTAVCCTPFVRDFKDTCLPLHTNKDISFLGKNKFIRL